MSIATLNKMAVLDTQVAANLELSTQFAERQWEVEFHYPLLNTSADYAVMVSDLELMIASEHGLGNELGLAFESSQERVDTVCELATHLIYITSSIGQDTISLPTIASQMERRVPWLHEDFQTRLNMISQMIADWAVCGFYTYNVTPTGMPLVSPLIELPESLQEDLKKRFRAPIPQMESTVGDLQSDGTGMVAGLSFSPKSSKRKIPLNHKNREFVTLLSQIPYSFDWDLVTSLVYAVPAISDNGGVLSDKEREDCKTGWYRFLLACELAHEHGENLCFPTSLDSRNRSYSLLNDPAVRQCLRSPTANGSLSPFEHSLLG